MTAPSFDYWDAQTGEGVSDYELQQRYAAMLDDVFGDVHIGGLSYCTSRALALVDPIAYRVGFSEWVDSEIGETLTDIEPAA